MTYQEKVKRSQAVVKAINELKNDEVLEFVYGEKENYSTGKIEPVKYKIKGYGMLDGEYMYYSVSRVDKWMSRMTVEKITPTTIKLYTYDMMDTRTTYNLPMYKMEIGQIITEEIKE